MLFTQILISIWNSSLNTFYTENEKKIMHVLGNMLNNNKINIFEILQKKHIIFIV